MPQDDSALMELWDSGSPQWAFGSPWVDRKQPKPASAALCRGREGHRGLTLVALPHEPAVLAPAAHVADVADASAVLPGADPASPSRAQPSLGVCRLPLWLCPLRPGGGGSHVS